MANLQAKTQDIDSLVEQILAEKRPESLRKDPKIEESRKESSLSPQKFSAKPKKKLELVSFVGEVNIGKGIIVAIILSLIYNLKLNLF